MIGESRYVFIDEAQRVVNIGLCLKLIADNIQGVKVVASGSSSFELANKIMEPLTGRKWEFWLFPFSHLELSAHHGAETERRLMQSRMIYGYYPEVVNNPGEEKDVLKELSGSYLYKDILTWERIQNLRNELKKRRKIYFYDNGIRNSVINQYSPLELRTDSGQLWENFLISGRMKLMINAGRYMSTYFWRTTAQQEIDYVEECDGNLKAFEMKWSPKRKSFISRSFTNAYPDADVWIITPENYEQFLSEY